MPEKKDSWKLFTIAFYNVENLFDTIDDPKTADNDFTEKGRLKWTTSRFEKKVRNLGTIIHQIGFKETNNPPALIGLAEIENAKVLKALINSDGLKNLDYGYIHFDSKDERGIDTALLYRKDVFSIINQKAHPVVLENDKEEKDYTRDVLEVTGIISGNKVHVLINHWPSRRAGIEASEPSRLKVSSINQKIIRDIRNNDLEAKIIVMGDFNDDPESKSVKTLVANAMYNPMELLLTKEKGSLTYKGNWNLFDQIIISQNFIQQYGNKLRFEKAFILDLKTVKVFEGIYKGHPFRTYAGPNYLGGISDHFPVYTIFKVSN